MADFHMEVQGPFYVHHLLQYRVAQKECNNPWFKLISWISSMKQICFCFFSRTVYIVPTKWHHDHLSFGYQVYWIVLRLCIVPGNVPFPNSGDFFDLSRPLWTQKNSRNLWRLIYADKAFALKTKGQCWTNGTIHYAFHLTLVSCFSA